MMRLSTQLVIGFFYLFVLLLFCQSRPARRPMRWRCPPSCNCSSDNVLCDGAASIPNSYPSNIISVSFRRCIFTSVSPGSFIPSQTLQILLFTSSTFDTIADDAFLGLKHLEYLFIENNKIRSISGNAFRGLKSLVHLSLSNNQLRSLPRGLFGNLPAVKHIDLRGNALNCDCQIKWLVQWMTGAGWNVAVWPPLPCAEPSKLSGRNLSDLTVKDFYCVASNVIQRWTFKFPSLSVHSFMYLSEQNVVITHPFEGRCSFMEWDHVAYRFREYDSIKGVSIVSCLPLVIGDQLFVVVAQLFGGSSIYRWDPNPGTISSFRLFQKLPETRKPNDVEYFRSGDEHFFIIADSAKSGASTLYRWDGRGFYTHQKMPHWYRDTDAEPMLLSGSTHLIMSSGSQRPVVYRFEDKRLRRLTDIPEAWDVYAVKHFTDPEDGVFACLVSYISESSLVRWDGSMFRQLQQLPSRGSHVFQPLLLGDKWHAFLGHDFGYAFVYQLEKWKHWEIEETGDREGQRGPLVQFQELRILAARSFTTVQVRGRQFVFVASFGGDTVVYEYVEFENNV